MISGLNPRPPADGRIPWHGLASRSPAFSLWQPRACPPAANPTSAAYTLVEIVVGLAMLGIVVSALITGATFGTQRTAAVRENLRATQVMLEKLEQIRLYTWDSIVYGYDPDSLEDDPDDPFDAEDPHTAADEPEPFVIPTTFTAPLVPGKTNVGDLIFQGTLHITNAPIADVAYSNQLALVTVGVTWTSRGRTHSRQMQTLFARYGMQNNIKR